MADSVVLAVGGPDIAMTAGGDETVRVVTTDARSGVWAPVTTESKDFSSQIEAKPAPRPRPGA